MFVPVAKLLEHGPGWVHLCWDPPPPGPRSQPIAYLIEMRQLEPQAQQLAEWIPLGEQRVGGEAEEADGRAGEMVTTSLDHFIGQRGGGGGKGSIRSDHRHLKRRKALVQL